MGGQVRQRVVLAGVLLALCAIAFVVVSMLPGAGVRASVGIPTAAPVCTCASR